MLAAILLLNTLNETLASLQKEMDLWASSLSEYDTFMSLFGVGAVLGSQLIAEIGLAVLSGKFNPQSCSIAKHGSAALRKILF